MANPDEKRSSGDGMRYAVLITLLVLIAAIVYWRRTEEMRYRVHMADESFLARLSIPLGQALEGVPQFKLDERLKKAVMGRELDSKLYLEASLGPRPGETPTYVVELLENQVHPADETPTFLLKLLSRKGNRPNPQCVGSFTVPPSGMRFLRDSEINALNDQKNYGSLGTIYFYGER